MQVDIKVDTRELVKEIAQEVIMALRPVLTGKSEDDLIYDVDTLAEYLKVSKKWIYERVQFKEIPYCKVGGNLRFKKSDIIRWMDSHKTPAINPLSRQLRIVK